MMKRGVEIKGYWAFGYITFAFAFLTLTFAFAFLTLTF